uniref:Uncharacterized protein n=1 Tax=Meloidogyne incognita TaxID=6306 RepID=A0A914LU14_MELIC
MGAASFALINASEGTCKGITGTGGRAASPSALTCSTYFGGSKFFRICSNSSSSFRPHSVGGRPLPWAIICLFDARSQVLISKVIANLEQHLQKSQPSLIVSSFFLLLFVLFQLQSLLYAPLLLDDDVLHLDVYVQLIHVLLVLVQLFVVFDVLLILAILVQQQPFPDDDARHCHAS